MEITKFIHENYGNKPINLIFCPYANPYNPWHRLPMKFYSEKNMVDNRIQNLYELSDSLIINNSVNLLVIRKYDLEHSIPVWMEKINSYFEGFPNQEILELYVYKD